MSEQPQEAYLVLVIGSERKVFPLREGGACRIGRSNDNSIVLNDVQVSRRHAMVQLTETGERYLTDLGSRNGTFLNRRRINAPATLQTGDRITIGSQEMEFIAPAAAPLRKSGAVETMLDVNTRLITVVVADIRDFTGLSRRLGEARLSETMSAFFRECGKVLNEQGAGGQKYIGDAVMAFWVHRDHLPTVREMVRVFRALTRLFDVAAGLQARAGLDCPVRISAGVNTGHAFVGNIGSSAASDYTALSDAVNLTFRLESASREIGCDVVLGPDTREFISKHVDLSALFEARTATLKGYEKPVEVQAGNLNSITSLLGMLERQGAEPSSEPMTEQIDVKTGK